MSRIRLWVRVPPLPQIGTVAQLVERSIEAAGVAGSNPARTTKCQFLVVLNEIKTH